jgi:hypothetical protein
MTRNTKHRVVTINLTRDGVAAADRLAAILSDEGWPHATRSLIIRGALERLREDLDNLSAEQIFFYFLKRRGTRAQ